MRRRGVRFRVAAPGYSIEQGWTLGKIRPEKRPATSSFTSPSGLTARPGPPGQHTKIPSGRKPPSVTTRWRWGGQWALTRYHLDAGAGGVAVGVHTTQFAIRNPKVALYQPVLALAAETAAEWEGRRRRPVLRVAGVVGPTPQALCAKRIARDLGYHLCLLSLGALSRASDVARISRSRAVAEVIPLMGFYLQPAVGGRKLSYRFWRRFAEIEGVVAIKVAPFDRYTTLNVVRAVADAEPGPPAGQEGVRKRSDGRRTAGPLGLLDPKRRLAGPSGWNAGPAPRPGAGGAAPTGGANHRCQRRHLRRRQPVPRLHSGNPRGVAGQGLLRGRWCLDAREDLSPGQLGEIGRVLAAYPHRADDGFVRSNLDRWLA